MYPSLHFLKALDVAKEKLSVLPNNQGAVIILAICASAIDEASSHTTRNDDLFKMDLCCLCSCPTRAGQAGRNVQYMIYF